MMENETLFKGIRNLFKLDFAPHRIYGLDILRVVAIIFVVFLHGISILPSYLTSIQIILNMDGVSFFFVLSGFLIGGILIKQLHEDTPTVKNLSLFWKKRWLRTIPNYLLVLVLLCVHDGIFDPAFSIWNVKYYFLFLQNFNYPPAEFYNVSWSLSIEEWFYLIIPTLIFIFSGLFKITPSRAILITAVLIIILTIGFRYYRFIQNPITTGQQWDLIFRKQVITRLDSLMLGVIGAYISVNFLSSWIRYKKVLFIAGILLLVSTKIIEILHLFPISSLYMCVFSFTTFEIGVLFLLPLLTQIKSGKGIIYKLISYISAISYSIYLFHYHIIKIWVIDNMDLTGMTGISLVIFKYFSYWTLTLFISILVYKFFEKPIMELRNKPLSGNKKGKESSQNDRVFKHHSVMNPQ